MYFCYPDNMKWNIFIQISQIRTQKPRTKCDKLEVCLGNDSPDTDPVPVLIVYTADRCRQDIYPNNEIVYLKHSA